MMRVRLLFAAALFAATPAGAQTPPAADPAVAAGRWLGEFAALSAEPATAVAACGPQLGNAVGAVHDAATARATLTSIRPCMERVRAAYRQSAEALGRFRPAPPEVRTSAHYDLDRLVDEQRKQFVGALSYMDQLDAFFTRVAANDRAGAAQIFPKLRAGGAALVDGTILQLRAYQAVGRFGFTRNALELRIVVAEATKLPMTGAVGPAGFAIGGSLNALVLRARAAVAAVRTSWEQDKVTLRALVGGDASMEQLIGPSTLFIDSIAASGDGVALALQRAGRRPVVPLTEVVALLNELNRHELVLAKSVQDFAQTLQTIGK
ncbi:hypothetical protein E5A73_02220 [Sphingomonas gei]|uniref:Uncharacterized protein n=1 Tax=Sphingomonas gei TaxID=1395960 RepID=A0A4S1XIC0_9SPHN|nr:hypothetical protein [Sphingomonas gei]TGX55951.1 hypothetical protein E5A73_02220 [Sphingomonas gei]